MKFFVYFRYLTPLFTILLSLWSYLFSRMANLTTATVQRWLTFQLINQIPTRLTTYFTNCEHLYWKKVGTLNAKEIFAGHFYSSCYTTTINNGTFYDPCNPIASNWFVVWRSITFGNTTTSSLTFWEHEMLVYDLAKHALTLDYVKLVWL